MGVVGVVLVLGVVLAAIAALVCGLFSLAGTPDVRRGWRVRAVWALGLGAACFLLFGLISVLRP